MKLLCGWEKMTNNVTPPNHKEHFAYHVTEYACPECYIVEFETRQIKLQHGDTWETRQQQERCVLCKRDYAILDRFVEEK